MDGDLGGDTFWILTTSGVQTWERGRKSNGEGQEAEGVGH